MTVTCMWAGTHPNSCVLLGHVCVSCCFASRVYPSHGVPLHGRLPGQWHHLLSRLHPLCLANTRLWYVFSSNGNNTIIIIIIKNALFEFKHMIVCFRSTNSGYSDAVSGVPCWGLAYLTCIKILFKDIGTDCSNCQTGKVVWSHVSKH